MEKFWKSLIWHQFGAAIDMLENAIRACPESLWQDRARHPEYWYVTYHTLFWLDAYLGEGLEGFMPPPPFNLDEMDPAGLMPERVYTQTEMLDYLAHGRTKCRAWIDGLTEEHARQQCSFSWYSGLSNAELLLNNMRHVQHHTAQLNLLLRQHEVEPPRWVKQAKE